MKRAPAGAPGAAHPEVTAALAECRRAFWSVAFFSGIVNVLMLAGPIYSLQIYDRVLSSRSVPTLVALSLLLVGLYAFMGVLDQIRSRIVVRVAELLDRRLGTTVHQAVMTVAIRSRNPAEAHQPVRDLDQVRAFLTSTGPIAIVDLPWMPAYLVICFLLHPSIGILSLAGAVVLIIVTFLTEKASRAPAMEVGRDTGIRAAMLEADRRNSETAAAMGMAATLAARWTAVNDRYLGAVERAADVVGFYGSITKVLRLLLQSAVLGYGSYLVIYNEMTAGGMIAASIMMGRALAPIETVIANWRGFVAARSSLLRLTQVLSRLRGDDAATALPAPRRSLEVEDVTVVAPGTQEAIVSRVQFRVGAGEALGIIGPSGAGKTSLVRVLVGIWPPARGTVRLDGAALDQWDPVLRGRHVGFVSQAVELFDGSIAENIARMEPEPDSEAVIRAAQAAGAHDMIVRFPGGYDTRIGEAGVVLSAGQRQRVALARALYGDPFLVVLDEPNANLDTEGERALIQALHMLKKRGAISIVIAHRPAILEPCDKVLLLAKGTQQAFGPRDEVLRKVMGGQPAPAPAAAGAAAAAAGASNLKLVAEGGGEDR